MKKTILSIGLAIGCAFSAAATDYMQSDDFVITNNVLIPGTNATLNAGGNGSYGQTNLVNGNFSFIGGRYGSVPFYNPIEQPYEVFELDGYFTQQTTANAALTNGLGTINPNSISNNIMADLAPVDDKLGMWGGPSPVIGSTNYSITWTPLETTNFQALFAYVPSTNFNNIGAEGAVDFRCSSSNNFIVQRFRKIGWVQKSP